ncbi:MAG: ankyrin repeat domain-containing protein [Bacteroidota bacterium]
MRNIFLILALISSVYLGAQSSNELLDRSFWRSSPSVDEVKKKIAEGHDPVAMTSAAFDATTYAIIDKAPVESVKHLLSIKGNEVDKNTHDGRNYLMWAAYAGNVELVKYLIDQGSDIKLVDDLGYSVIPFCATTGMDNPEIYDVLVANGAKISDTNRDGANPILLVSAHLEDDYSIIEYFKKKGLAIDAKDDAGNGLFNYAARKGNLGLMKKAVEWGLPYQDKNSNGGNAVLFASRGYRAHTNGMEVYRYLDKMGLDMDVVTKDGETPLHSIAFRVKDMDIYDYFIKQGIDINQANKEGNTLLLNAINGRNNDVAKAFMPKVADLNHKNKDGYSALSNTVRRYNAAIFADLISAGADAKVVDKKGNNLIALTFESYRKGQEEPFQSMLAVLQKKGVDPLAQQAKGNTLLHIAVEKGNTYLLDQALALGADLNAKNSDGLTATHLAAMKAKDATILNLLIGKGADTSIKTDFEETLYDLASENELLKKSGFDLDQLKR